MATSTPEPLTDRDAARIELIALCGPKAQGEHLPTGAVIDLVLANPKVVLQALGGVQSYLGMGNTMWQFPGIDFPEEKP